MKDGRRNTASELNDMLRKVFGGLPRGIVFDCDGVLVDSEAANLAYYGMLRRELSLPPLTEDQSRYCQMSSVAQAIDYIIPKALQPCLKDIMAKCSYKKEIEPLIGPAAHIHALLDFCAAAGIRLGVFTNRVDPLDDMFSNCGLTGYFDPVVTVGPIPPKPDPAGLFIIAGEWGLKNTDMLFIGDSSTDRDAAVAAVIPFLAYRNPSLTEDGFCGDFADLLEALKGMDQTFADKTKRCNGRQGTAI
ncbi:MAG: HAD family hydrolase [Mailhella sp.]|nr:HAD family hydrolase [Mailhella sp.]